MLDKVFTNNQVTIAGEVVSLHSVMKSMENISTSSISQYADLAIRMM